jgi:preprotein translocase subunit SecG
MPKEMKWALSFMVGAALLFLGWRVYPFLVTLHVGVCLVLIVVILLQSGEAADLAGAFGGSGSQTAFGPRGAATFLSRATTWCAVMFMFTSMVLAVHVRTAGGGGASGHSVLEQFSQPSKPAAPGTPPQPLQSAPTAPVPPAPPGVPPPQSAPAQPAPPAK